MLVLSRRPGQRIVFPTLDVSVEVLQSQRGVVRIGVQAPPDVRVLRNELFPTDLASPARKDHDRRGQMNLAMMGLYLAEQQMQAGQLGDAEATLQEALRNLESLERSPQAVREGQAGGPKKGIRALLVEDDRNEQSLLASYLRMSGIGTETAHDGDEALEVLARQAARLDFVLLDMGLPGRDGPSTVAAIRAREAYQDVRIFAVTGSPPEQVGVTIGPGGVDNWFLKPLSPASLVEAMNAAVRNN